MNKLKLLAMSLLVGVLSTGCSDILDDNENPDKAAGITAEAGLPTVIFYAAHTQYDHTEYYIYLSQCLTTTGKSQTGSYGYKNGWEFLTMNRHPQWRRHYFDIGLNVRNLIENAEEAGSPNYVLIARTIRLMSTQLTTDLFGDIPRSNAYLVNSPTYDTQASIYAWMLDEADQLIKDFDDPAFTQAPGNQNISKLDRIYHGDLNKWKGLVYALKARILLRNIPNVDTSAATCQAIYDAAQKAIDVWRQDATYGTFFGCEPRYNFDGGVQQENSPWSEVQPIINSWESRANLLTSAVPSKFFVADIMGVFNQGDAGNEGKYVARRGYGDDPRISLLFEPRNGPISATDTKTETIKLRWLENNIGVPNTSFIAQNYPNLYAGAYAGSADAYIPLFTMEELYFIQAEAMYWMNQKSEACRLAKEATRANIQRHLEAFQKKYPEVMYPGQKIADGYTKIDANDKEEGVFTLSEVYWNAWVTAFLDNEAMPEFKPDGKKYPNRVMGVTDPATKGNHHWYFNPSEFSLSDLMQMKYVAMYMQTEQWTDMRRYHYSNNRNNYGIGDNKEIVYPTLRRPYNLYAPYWIDGLSETEKENTWIQRINYGPETEEKYNRTELERLGAYKNYKWLREPMIWSQPKGVRTSLTAE